MSTFATFLTNGPSDRRHNRHGKVDLKQKFLRESNKYFPKPIKPKVNVNPVVNYMINQENRNQEQEQYHQKTMKYKNCLQIIPTVGMSNLIFYDCHKKATAERSLEESISKLEEPTLTLATEDSYDALFFEQEVITESVRHSVDVVTSNPNDWTSHNFDEFDRAPQTFRDLPVQDFTFASYARSSLLSSGIDSYTSFEMDFSRQAYDRNDVNHAMQHPDMDSFETNFNHLTNQFRTQPPDVDTFNMTVTGQSDQGISNMMDADSPNLAGDSQLNSSDWHMESNISRSEDESMAKFAISSCCDISFEEIDGHEFYANFVPLHTSTPNGRNKLNSRNDVDHELTGVSELSLLSPNFVPLHTSSPTTRAWHDMDIVTEELLHNTDEELFFDRQERVEDPRDDFSFSDRDDLFF